MTRLVGSEMCIRDRYNAIPKNIRDRGRASARIAKKNKWRL
jgi:hypothetical protein